MYYFKIILHRFTCSIIKGEILHGNSEVYIFKHLIQTIEVLLIKYNTFDKL